MRLSRTFLSIIPLVILLAFTTIIETGCGGGGGGDTAAVPTNLSLVSVSSPSPAGTLAVGLAAVVPLEVGHPVDVALEINSTRAIEEVTVSFYIADQEEFDAGADDSSAQFHIGSAVLPPLHAGINRIVQQVTLPYSEEAFEIQSSTPLADDPDKYISTFTEEPNLDGTFDPTLVYVLGRPYYLFVEIDPANLIEETNEDDNLPTEATMAATMATATISELGKTSINIIVESVEVEIPDIEMTPPVQEEQLDSCGVAIVPERPAVDQADANSHIGVTAVINATGRYWPGYPDLMPVPIPRVDIQATIFPPISDLPNGIDLQIWDSTTKSYTNTLSIYDLNPGDPTSVQLDLRLPGYEGGFDNAMALISEMANVATQCMRADCNLDQSVLCFISQIPPAGYCDPIVESACRTEFGAYGDLEVWNCIRDRVDPRCIAACPINDSCLYDCAVEAVGFEVKIEAFESVGSTTPIVDYEPNLVVGADNIFDRVDIVMRPTPAPPPPVVTEPVLYETGFDKGFSAKFAYAGLKAYAKAELNGDGANASLEAAIPVVLFRSKPRSCVGDGCISGLDPGDVFLGVTSYLSATPPNYINDNFDLNISSYGVNLFPKLVPISCGGTLFGAFSQDSVDTCTKSGATGAALAECYKAAGGIYKSKDVTKNFVVGIVPLTASFSAWGTIGAELVISTTCSGTGLGLSSHAGPYADLGTEVSAGVGNSRFLAVGVGGELNPLFGNTFFATVALQDLTLNEGFISGRLHEDITNTLTGPKGSVFWYLGYPCVKLCGGWFPCGLKQCKYKKPFVSFKTFERKDVLFCAEQSFNGPSVLGL